MENIDFLKQILMSDVDYWIVAKKNEYRQYLETKRGEDYIMLIHIPYTIRRGLKYDEITLRDLETLQRIDVQNIFINNDYPPFQTGQTLYNVYTGYPITGYIHKFLTDALALKSNSIYDYKKLLHSEQKVQVSDTTEAQ